MTVVPMVSTRTSPATDATYTSGAMIRTHRWSVASTSTISTRPIATLTSCFFRYADGSPPVRSSRWVVADHTSTLPSSTRPSTASIRIQSMRGALVIVSAPSGPAAGSEPSFMNVGSRSAA